MLPFLVVGGIGVLLATNVFAQTTTTAAGTTTTAAGTTTTIPVCTMEALSFTRALPGIAMMHTDELYEITNGSTSACSLTGYPQVAAYPSASGPASSQLTETSAVATGMSAVGGPLATVVSDVQIPGTSAAPTPVDLPPGTSAAVVVSFNMNPDDDCQSIGTGFVTLALTLPGSTQASPLLQWRSNICPSLGDNKLFVSPVLSIPAAMTYVEQGS
ncbi:MAG: DUF4232 domain-containing protein [Solirubrobacteraceae bacterium]